MIIDRTVFVILCVVVGCLILRPLMAILIYTLMLLSRPYRKEREHNSFLKKLLAYPSIFLNRKIPESNRYLLYHISMLPWMGIRKILYRSLGARIARNVQIHFRTEIRAIENLKIGEGSILGDNALLDARNGLSIGKNVNISSNVSFYTQQHNYRDPLFRCNQTFKQSIEIEDRAWIGPNVLVLPGVKIGEGAVCGAGSVVVKDVEPWTVVAGIPAQKINDRPIEQEYNFKSNLLALI